MKRWIVSVLSAFVLFSGICTVSISAEGSQTEDNDTADRVLESSEIIDLDGETYRKDVFVTRTVLSRDGNHADIQNEYEIGLKPVNSRYVIGSIHYVTYDEPFWSYSVWIRAKMKYTTYSASSSIDYATYYKINQLTFSYTDLESPITVIKTKLYIQNNGVSETSGVTNQERTTNIGNALSGTLNGYTSWRPTYSDEVYKTRVGFKAELQRGTNVYDITWFSPGLQG
ncbi:MAG: hypothetical protein K6A40_13405 [Solobacterium sp.]|nr:hypothetical protein [Solobacterium sp.]